MNQKQLAAIQLQNQLGLLIKREREVLNEILDLIIRADSERTYLTLGFSSLFAWLTVHFHYCESSAKRRIDAARLKKAVPSLEDKIDSGTLNVTIMSKAQSAIRAEEKRTNTKLTAEQKANVVTKIEGKSGNETEKILIQEFPDAQLFQREKSKVISVSEVSVTSLMSHEDHELLVRAKEVLSHSIPCGSTGKVIAAALREFLKHRDPLREKPKDKHSVEKYPSSQSNEKENHKAQTDDAKSESFKGDASSSVRLDNDKSTSRHIPNPNRRSVLHRDIGSCQFRNPETGKICGSKYQVEVDHIMPWALGGSNETDNLQCLCANHNRYRGEMTFGTRRDSRPSRDRI